MGDAFSWQSGSLERPDGVRIHYGEAGEGPLVLLAHGYLLNHSLFDRVAPRLVAQGLRVVAFDQRGHGRTPVRVGSDDAGVMADDYAALIEALSPTQPITLVGHSMGGFLAVLAGLRHPDLYRSRVGRLVLLGANAGHVGKGSLANRLQVPLLRAGLLPPLWRIKPIGSPLMRALFGDRVDPADVEWTRKTVIGNDPKLAVHALDAMVREDYYPRLPELAVPTRVLCGTRDQTCPPWHSERLARDVKGASLQWLEGAGHMLPLESVEAVVEAILSDRG